MTEPGKRRPAFHVIAHGAVYLTDFHYRASDAVPPLPASAAWGPFERALHFSSGESAARIAADFGGQSLPVFDAADSEGVPRD